MRRGNERLDGPPPPSKCRGWGTHREINPAELIRPGKLPGRVQADADLEAAAVVLIVVVVDAEEEPAFALDGELGVLAHEEGQHGAAFAHLADERAAALIVHRQLANQVLPVAPAAVWP